MATPNIFNTVNSSSNAPSNSTPTSTATRLLRIGTLSLIALSLLTTAVHQWRRYVQHEHAMFLLNQYEQQQQQKEVTGDESTLHHQALNQDSVPQVVEPQSQNRRQLVNDDDDGIYEEDGSGYGYKYEGPHPTLPPAISAQLPGANRPPSTKAPTMIPITEAPATEAPVAEPPVLITTIPTTQPVEELAATTAPTGVLREPAPEPLPTALPTASDPLAGTNDPTTPPDVDGVSLTTGAPSASSSSSVRDIEGGGTGAPSMASSLTETTVSSSATTSNTNLRLVEQFSCLQIDQLQLQVWFHADTDAVCLSDECVGTTKCCRYHPSQFLQCDTDNALVEYPCLCHAHTADPATLPVSQTELDMPSFTMEPTTAWTMYPTTLLETLPPGVATGRPSDTQTFTPTAGSSASGGISDTGTTTPTQGTPPDVVESIPVMLSTATTTTTITEDGDRVFLMEPDDCMPFDQAAPMGNHPRSHEQCKTPLGCGTGCCRIRTWLECDASNEYADFPCVCNANTNIKAEVSDEITATDMETAEDTVEVPVVDAPEDGQSDVNEEVDVPAPALSDTIAFSFDYSQTTVSKDACANGSPLFANPSFAHFTKCVSSPECATLDSTHCCLERFCMCGTPKTDPLQECVPPFRVITGEPTAPPTASPTELSTTDVIVETAITDAPTDAPTSAATTVAPKGPPSEDACLEGTVYHSMPSFAQYTICESSADCGDDDVTHCCLERYCMCGPPTTDAATECVPPFAHVSEQLPAFTLAPKEDDQGEDIVAIMVTSVPTSESSLSLTQEETEPLVPLIELEACRSFDDSSIGHHKSHPNVHETCLTNSCARGCCRTYWWLVCDEANDFKYIPCVCNENTQDPDNFVPYEEESESMIEAPLEPHKTCSEGSPFQSQPGYEGWTKCYSASDCGGEGECCLSRYCLCGKDDGSSACVPPGPESDGDTSETTPDTGVEEEDFALDGAEDEPTFAPSTDLPTTVPPTKLPTTEAPTEKSNILSITPVATPLATPLIESVACVPFDGNILIHANHPNSHEQCKTNSCSNGCCRSYWWLVCDETNQFTHAPCVCNEHTRDPASFPLVAETEAPQETAPEDVCRQGSFFQEHSSFSAMTPCFGGDECGSGQCCLSKFCLCGVPSDATDECVPPIPDIFLSFPSSTPSVTPTTGIPTGLPTGEPTVTLATEEPTRAPKASPSGDPTPEDSGSPTVSSTMKPTGMPTSAQITSSPSFYDSSASDREDGGQCANGHPVFHSLPSFSHFETCVTSDDCPTALGECCLANYCLCGPPRDDATLECVPSLNTDNALVITSGENPTDASETFDTSAITKAPTNAPRIPLVWATEIPAEASIATGAPTATSSSSASIEATSSTSDEVHVIEQLACVPFDGSIIIHSEHPSTDATCRTNTCPNGCCRSYWWLMCDESNSYPFAPCVCNENTQDPESFVSNKPPTPPPISREEASQDPAVCENGSTYQRLPSFRSLTPCFNGEGCGDGECCVAKYCLCMNPDSVDECVVPVPENVILDSSK